MSHRTQVIINDWMYERLRSESARTGVRLGELIRRALAKAYGRTESSKDALELSFGAWEGREFDGETYVEQLRTGLAKRLAR